MYSVYIDNFPLILQRRLPIFYANYTGQALYSNKLELDFGRARLFLRASGSPYPV